MLPLAGFIWLINFQLAILQEVKDSIGNASSRFFNVIRDSKTYSYGFKTHVQFSSFDRQLILVSLNFKLPAWHFSEVRSVTLVFIVTFTAYNRTNTDELHSKSKPLSDTLYIHSTNFCLVGIILKEKLEYFRLLQGMLILLLNEVNHR